MFSRGLLLLKSDDCFDSPSVNRQEESFQA